MNYHTRQKNPVSIIVTKTLAGGTCYTVRQTRGSRHITRVFKCQKRAEEQRDIWEQQNQHASTLALARGTSLTLQQIRECELAQRLLKDTGINLVEAALHCLRQKQRE
jgi:hypothetical protein